MRALLLLLMASSCIGTGTTTCPGGKTSCREGTVCLQLAPDDELCVRPDQFPPCDGLPDAASCTLTDDMLGTCFGGACLPATCGNNRMDAGEVCDDGGNEPGDLCSADCRSRETCGNGIVDPGVFSAGLFIQDEQCDDTNLAGHDGCSSLCTIEGARWSLVSSVGPRSSPAVTYDAKRRRLVLFGGRRLVNPQFGSGQTFGDTWEFDGRAWTPVAPAFTALSPSARSQHAMAYDAQHGQAVMFGGRAANLLGDTWLLDGNHWRLATTTDTPSPRASHAMTYHPNLGVVLFGGETPEGTSLDDTWVWNGTTWRELPFATRPTARSRHAMAYDPIRDVIVLAGGTPATSTWELDGTRWVEVAPDNSGPRWTESAMGFDPVGRRMVLFGGEQQDPDRTTTADTWSWNGVAWTRLALSASPTRRGGAAVANDPETGLLTMFGGHREPEPMCLSCSHTANQETWHWTGTAWLKVPPSPSNPVTGHAGALDSARGRVIIFGGISGGNSLTDETLEHDGRHWFDSGTAGGARPPARAQAAMAYDVARSRAVMFGGAADGILVTSLGDTWTYSAGTWTRYGGPGPSARRQHAMSYDARRQRVVMFGGTGTTSLGDTWEWDGGAWTRVLAGSPVGERTNARLAYDPIAERVLLFGGLTKDGIYVADLWAWDGASWTPLPASLSPPARETTGFAWDPARRRMVLFGGGSPTGDDTWEWDGTAWSFVSFSGVVPAPRSEHLLVSSPDGAGVLLIGGSVANGVQTEPSDEVWYLRRESADSYQSCRTTLDDDLDGLDGCKDPDCWARCTPECLPGATCDPAAPHCGDGVCNPELETCGVCADCACGVRCGDFLCDPTETAATCPGDCP